MALGRTGHHIYVQFIDSQQLKRRQGAESVIVDDPDEVVAEPPAPKGRNSANRAMCTKVQRM